MNLCFILYLLIQDCFTYEEMVEAYFCIIKFTVLVALKYTDLVTQDLSITAHSREFTILVSLKHTILVPKDLVTVYAR